MVSPEPNKNTIKILEQTQVSPPPGSVPPTKLPLTFFDYMWLMCCPIQRLFFYHLPHPTQHLIPNLKHSLSLTLRHFFPLAATLHLPPPPHKPFLLYSGDGSVQLTIAESSGDFNELISNHAKDVKELHPFVPKLSQAHNYALPVLALQVTTFPNFSFCVGVANNHVAADGRSMINFIKSWASICNTMKSQELTSLDVSTLEQAPSHDRGVIKNPSVIDGSDYLESTYSRVWNCKKETSSMADLSPPLNGMVRATLLMGRAHIDWLKVWVSAQFVSHEETRALHVSSFVAASAFTWVHLIKSGAIGEESSEEHEGDVICYFPILADCRNRKGFEFPVPDTYFGNCVAQCMVKIKRSDLVGEYGIFVAAKAIATRIKDLENGALREADKWSSNIMEARKSGNVMTFAGSPNLCAYDIDFGWGRPKKIEIIHIDISRGLSLTESGEEKGGVEIGVALHKNKMNTFVVSFKQGLKLLSK